MRHLMFAFMLSGCVVVHENPQPAPCTVPTGMTPDTTAPVIHISATAVTGGVPAGSVGYAIVGNGQGGYTFTMIDDVGSPNCYSGAITVVGQLDPNHTQPTSGSLSWALADNQIAWAVVPGAQANTFELVSSTEPIYVTALVNGAEAPDIFFIDPTLNTTATTSSPATFTSY
jgi:hypothetical protein